MVSVEHVFRSLDMEARQILKAERVNKFWARTSIPLSMRERMLQRINGYFILYECNEIGLQIKSYANGPQILRFEIGNGKSHILGSSMFDTGFTPFSS